MTTLKKLKDSMNELLQKVPRIFRFFVFFLLLLIPTTIFLLRLLAIVGKFREFEEFYFVELPISALVTWSMITILTLILTSIFFLFFLWEMFRKKTESIQEKTMIYDKPTLNISNEKTKVNHIQDLEDLERIQAKRKKLIESMAKIEKGEDLTEEDMNFLEGLEKEFNGKPEIIEEPEDIDSDRMDAEIKRLQAITHTELARNLEKQLTTKKNPLDFLKKLKIFQREKPKRKKNFNPKAMPL